MEIGIWTRAGQALDHRQHAAQLLLLGQRVGARPGRLAADVDDVRAVGRHPHARLDGAIDVVEEHAAVGERIGGDVEDPHHEGARAQLERGFPGSGTV